MERELLAGRGNAEEDWMDEASSEGNLEGE